MYTLARCPDALPRLHTYSEVSGKVLGGADLFLQGLLVPGGGPLPGFLANSVQALCVPGNPAPFAVGTMAVSRTEAERAGMKGRGLELLHCFGDLLWHMGAGTAPNQGFTPTRIFPLPDPGSQVWAWGHVEFFGWQGRWERGVEDAVSQSRVAPPTDTRLVGAN